MVVFVYHDRLEVTVWITDTYCTIMAPLEVLFLLNCDHRDRDLLLLCLWQTFLISDRLVFILYARLDGAHYRN